MITLVHWGLFSVLRLVINDFYERHINSSSQRWEIRGVLGAIAGRFISLHFGIAGYPLVNQQKAIENDHRNSGFSH